MPHPNSVFLNSISRTYLINGRVWREAKRTATEGGATAENPRDFIFVAPASLPALFLSFSVDAIYEMTSTVLCAAVTPRVR
jgi:hypothetical protein